MFTIWSHPIRVISGCWGQATKLKVRKWSGGLGLWEYWGLVEDVHHLAGQSGDQVGCWHSCNKWVGGPFSSPPWGSKPASWAPWTSLGETGLNYHTVKLLKNWANHCLINQSAKHFALFILHLQKKSVVSRCLGVSSRQTANFFWWKVFRSWQDVIYLSGPQMYCLTPTLISDTIYPLSDTFGDVRLPCFTHSSKILHIDLLCTFTHDWSRLHTLLLKMPGGAIGSQLVCLLCTRMMLVDYEWLWSWLWYLASKLESDICSPYHIFRGG